MRRTIAFSALGALLFATDAFAADFGFGAVSQGGKGGRIIEVTNLNDTGSGSLRACLTSSGPRTCSFKVAGLIEVEKRLEISNGRVTVDGDSAPNKGITIRYSTATKEGGPLFAISGDDVTVRNLRLRRGPTSLARKPGGSCCGDVIEVNGADRVLLDRLSMSFSTDEIFSVIRSRNVTLQNSILSYALARSTDSDTLKTGKSHSKGTLVGYGSDRVSLINNVWAMVEGRGCRFKSGSRHDCRGNLFYGMRQSEVILSDRAKINVIANAFQRPTKLGGSADEVIDTRGGAAAFATDNKLGQDRQLWAKGASKLGSPVAVNNTPRGLDASDVMENAGAKPRDELDNIVMAHIKARTGDYIDHPSEVIDWPALEGGSGGNGGDEPNVTRNDLKELRKAYDAARAATKAHERLKKEYRRADKDREWKDELKKLRKAERQAKDAYQEAKRLAA